MSDWKQTKTNKCTLDSECSEYVVPDWSKDSTGTCCGAISMKDIGNLNDEEYKDDRALLAYIGFPAKVSDPPVNFCIWYGGDQTTPSEAPTYTTYQWVCDGGASSLMAGIAGVTAYVSLM